MTSPETVAAAALDILRERGWHQGDFGGDGAADPVCLLGAVNLAEGRAVFEMAWDSPCVERITRLIGTENVGFGWNDDPHTTFEDVALVLKRVANGEGAE